MANKDSRSALEPLGARIRRLRSEQGLTQDLLAIRAKVDQSGLSKLERSKVRGIGPVPLTRIARILGMSFQELVDGTNYKR